MLLYMYQIFSSLQGLLHFFVHFFFISMEHFFIDHPILPNFVNARNLTCAYDLIPSFDASTQYTRCNLKQNSFSLLDYIFLSEDLVPYVDSVEIINDAINTSDHLPVRLSLSVNVAATCTKRNC